MRAPLRIPNLHDQPGCAGMVPVLPANSVSVQGPLKLPLQQHGYMSIMSLVLLLYVYSRVQMETGQSLITRIDGLSHNEAIIIESAGYPS